MGIIKFVKIRYSTYQRFCLIKRKGAAWTVRIYLSPKLDAKEEKNKMQLERSFEDMELILQSNQNQTENLYN